MYKAFHRSKGKIDFCSRITDSIGFTDRSHLDCFASIQYVWEKRWVVSGTFRTSNCNIGSFEIPRTCLISFLSRTHVDSILRGCEFLLCRTLNRNENIGKRSTAWFDWAPRETNHTFFSVLGFENETDPSLFQGSQRAFFRARKSERFFRARTRAVRHFETAWDILKM